MSKMNVFPHGFKSRSSMREDSQTTFNYDRDVADLYRTYINNEVDFNSWDFKLNILEESFRLFGPNFEEWCLLQINDNTMVYNQSLDFLLDTLNFISGKDRKTTPFVWRELLLTNPESKTMIEISNRRIRRIRDLFPLLKTDTASILQMWCSRENGFEDLVNSIFLFFGPSTNVSNRAIQTIQIA